MIRKWIIRILTFAALAVFLYSVGSLLAVWLRYRQGEKLYQDAAESYTKAAPRPAGPNTAASTGAEEYVDTPDETATNQRDNCAPIVVDFAALQALNGDIFAWIYCEDTVINYPVAHCDNNELYLDYGYNRKPCGTGTIFSDAGNRYGVQDSNIIIYGHHMQDMSMFATLKYWFEQEYYDTHPVMWLLTPEQDYRVDLYSVHSTSATSDTYSIFFDPSEQFDSYLKAAKEHSAFSCDVEPDGQLHHVLLSTCAYSYYNERTVLHGQLVPLNSAGGVPFETENVQN